MSSIEGIRTNVEAFIEEERLLAGRLNESSKDTISACSSLVEAQRLLVQAQIALGNNNGALAARLFAEADQMIIVARGHAQDFISTTAANIDTVEEASSQINHTLGASVSTYAHHTIAYAFAQPSQLRELQSQAIEGHDRAYPGIHYPEQLEPSISLFSRCDADLIERVQGALAVASIADAYVGEL